MSTPAVIHINNGPGLPGALDVETDQLDVTTEHERDPNWTHVDANGHFHAWSTDGELPTLIGRTRHAYCDGACDGACDNEGYDVTDRFCSICDEPVEPGHRRTVGRRYTEGRTWWTAEVTSDQTFAGLVSVRIEVDGKVRFGTAQATVARMDHDVNGLRITTRLVAASALGERLSA